MPECKWCWETGYPLGKFGYRSENCRVNHMASVLDPKERAQLEDAFDKWIEEE